MSILQNKINVSDIQEIITFYYKNKEEVCREIKSDYFNTIVEEDVVFLNKEKYLQDCNPIEKMKIFHLTLKTISLMMFNAFIKKSNTVLNKKIYFDMQSYDEKMSRTINLDLIEEKIEKLEREEILVALRELYVDLLCLVSRKNSGTEFTPIRIVKFMFDSISYYGEKITKKRLLEPACGSGIFLQEALKRILNNNIFSFKEIFDLIVNGNIITGYDINPINVFSTKLLLLCVIIDKFNDISEKELILLYNNFPIVCENSLKIIEGNYDYVIGNPPYIRLQNLSIIERDYIKENFESATGRFDLYVCFIEKSIKLLKKNGKMSIITSNKYLTSNYGKGIRNYILDNFCIDVLFDLNDTKYFEASVLPSILTGHKDIISDKQEINYFHLKQNNNKKIESTIQDVFMKDFEKYKKMNFIREYFLINNGRVNIDVEFVFSKEKLPDKNIQWNFGAKEDTKIKEQIEFESVYLLSEIADVCVGIKSTADEVFVKPMTEKFIVEKKIERDILFPLIQQHNVKKWKINWNKENKDDKYILYPHKVVNDRMKAIDLEKYPFAEKYLIENEERLKSRTYLMESKVRKWYELWVPQSLIKFNKPKIITADIASTNSFALDLSGRICQGNTFFITLQDSFLKKIKISQEEYLKYLLGILNSEIMEFYQKSISGSLYSKKYRYTTTNINRWPIPIITEGNKKVADNIIKIIEEIITNQEIDLVKKEREMNSLVYQLYKISDEDIKVIESFLSTNR